MRDGAGAGAPGLVRPGLTSVLAASWLEALVCTLAVALRPSPGVRRAHETMPVAPLRRLAWPLL